MNFADYFKGKKITAMGLGLLGRGVGDIAYMAEAGAKEIIVTDVKDEAQLAPSVEKLRMYKNITFVLGEHRTEDFVDRDLVLVSAGVPVESPYLQAARDAKTPMKQSAALFAELSNVPIIGITGTRGKSTVTEMIHHVLQFTTGEEVLLGGNIRGVSNLQLLPHVKDDSLCVMELDSWQLQGFGWNEFSPQIAVFTNFMEDHLNYYKAGGRTQDEAMDAYFADKANIFRYQEESGVFVTTPEVFARAQTLRGVTLGQEVVLADASVIPEDALLAMPGEHNRLNAALALEALRAVGLTEEEIFAGLATFPGVEGRLQYVRDIEGVKVFNDNNATTPQATIAGIEALSDGDAESPAAHQLVLVCGGAEKDVDITPLVDAMVLHCKAVVTIPGSGTDKLIAALEAREARPQVVQAEHLKQAVDEARLLTEPGDSILFSPAFASFSQYKNEYERNDEFLEIVNTL